MTPLRQINSPGDFTASSSQVYHIAVDGLAEFGTFVLQHFLSQPRKAGSSRSRSTVRPGTPFLRRWPLSTNASDSNRATRRELCVRGWGSVNGRTILQRPWRQRRSNTSIPRQHF
jgi:hypothetical protein